MQSDSMHDLVHDKSCPSHIARVFHEGDEEVENQYIRKENNDTTYSTQYTGYDQIFLHSLMHKAVYLGS